MQPTEPTHRNGAQGEAAVKVEAFDYPACSGAPSLPPWDGWVEVGDCPAPGPAEGRAKGASGKAPGYDARRDSRRDSHHDSRRDFDQRLAEETRKSFAAGRERGRQEGIQTEREAQAAALTAEAEGRQRQLGEIFARFSRERDRYLQAVEQEVVKLALAVAARILRREAQMDPLLLTGAVRVALGQLARSSEVRLRVPAGEVDLWTQTIALLPNLTLKPVVVAEEDMRLGDCVIESKMGVVDLGLRSQLAEIERGFFDRAGSSTALKTGSGRQEPARDPEPVAGEALA